VFFLFFRFSIAAMAVLAIHKRLRPSAATDCNCKLLHHWSNTLLSPIGIRSDCYRLPAHQSFSRSYPGMPLGECRRWDNYGCNPLGV
jgi:hypothetical protein